MPPSIQNAANASVISSSSFGEEDGVNQDHHPLAGRSFRSIANEPVFPLVQKVKQEVVAAIDTNLSYQQLQSPTVNFSVVRPLRLKLSSAAGTPPAALVYALLLNRQHFLAESKVDLAFSGLNATRADLCELLAIKSLSLYGECTRTRDGTCDGRTEGCGADHQLLTCRHRAHQPRTSSRPHYKLQPSEWGD